jgi:hypothetical protein
MMPIRTAIELEVPVIGRSYSPAFFGAFCAMRNSFARNNRYFSYTLGTLAFYACGTGCNARGIESRYAQGIGGASVVSYKGVTHGTKRAKKGWRV